MKLKMLTFTLVFNLLAIFAGSENFTLKSPDGNLWIKISVENEITYSLYFKSEELISPSSVFLFHNKNVKRKNELKIVDIERSSVYDVLYPVIKQKSKEIAEEYNELKIYFANNFNLVFRAYDIGAAYRFETEFDGELTVLSEKANFNLSANEIIYFPEEESFQSHNERIYHKKNLSDLKPDQFCSLPALIEKQNGVKVLISESDLDDYPGLWLKINDQKNLEGILPGVALKTSQPNDRDENVEKHADYLAETNGERSYPWRILAVAENDADLITNQLVYLLGKPLQLDDVSWIKPGKVAWDWWNDWNIYGVDFKAGVNTATYKYYIDFASKYGLEYIILDEGWYELGDLMKVVPEIDIEEIVNYGKEKNVGVILWVIWKTLDNQLTESLDQFEEWGVKGIKVDFMQRDDQWMVQYYHKIAKEAADRKMLVNFHGSYKPAGLRRAYPNVITREGVKGLENVKWSKHITPEHNLTLPFTRMVAGPMDYTPGAMVNTHPKNFNISWSRPMSMGTRCHQLALYVNFESPLQMLADNPSNYLSEPKCMEFLKKVPTVWDETKVLHARIGDYLVTARKYVHTWYIGAMTDENAREFELDFSFLDDGNYQIEIWKDGINVDKYASDFATESLNISNSDKMKIKLAAGGGWVAIIKSIN